MLVGIDVRFLQDVLHVLAVFRSLQDGSTNEKRYLCQTRVEHALWRSVVFSLMSGDLLEAMEVSPLSHQWIMLPRAGTEEFHGTASALCCPKAKQAC